MVFHSFGYTILCISHALFCYSGCESKDCGPAIVTVIYQNAGFIRNNSPNAGFGLTSLPEWWENWEIRLEILDSLATIPKNIPPITKPTQSQGRPLGVLQGQHPRSADPAVKLPVVSNDFLGFQKKQSDQKWRCHLQLAKMNKNDRCH